MKGETPWESDWEWEVHTQRRESGLIEHICSHGIGHPTPGSVLWQEEAEGIEGPSHWSVHGCDGCCADPTFPGYKASLVIAHTIIRKQNIQLKELSERVTEMALSISEEADGMPA